MDGNPVHDALVEARHTRLTRSLGGSPRTREVAARLVQADLLRAAAGLLAEEAQRLDELGLPIQAGYARKKGDGARQRAGHLEEEAYRLEAACFPGCDGERYVTLRRALRRLARDVDARNMANDLLQGAERLGFLAAEYLWDLLRRACGRREIPFPEDLHARFAEARAREEATAAAVEAGRDARALLREAETLLREAPGLEKDDLLDRIVSIGARLKLLQEDRERRGLPTLGLPVHELDDEGRHVRVAFGILSGVSKERQPGWTEVLDPRARNRDWSRLAQGAEARLRARARERRRIREEARRRQVEEARRTWREAIRRVGYEDAVERLRALLYRIDEGAGVREAARVEAAIACRLAEGDEDRLRRIAQLLEGHRELVATGRAFRGLRRLLGIEPEPLAVAPAAPVEAEEDPADEAAEEAAEEAGWPEWVLDLRDAGRGERVLLVGGMPNERRLQVLEEFFGWRDARWEESYRDHSADFDVLKRQVREGRWDRVVVLSRFCGHDVTQALSAATRKARVPYLIHPRSPTIPSLAATLYGQRREPRRET